MSAVGVPDTGALRLRSMGDTETYTVLQPRDDCGLFEVKGFPKLLARLQSAQDKALLARLPPEHSGIEKLIFAVQLTKINRKKKRQKRVLVLTSLALYNFGVNSYRSCKRRIGLRDVSSLQVNAANIDEFVVKVIGSYDYRFEASGGAEMLVASICEAWDELARHADPDTDAYLHVHKLTDHKMIEATLVNKAESLKKVQSASRMVPQSKRATLSNRSRRQSLIGKVKRRFSMSPAKSIMEPVANSESSPIMKNAPGQNDASARGKPRRKSIVDLMGDDANRIVGVDSHMGSSNTVTGNLVGSVSSTTINNKRASRPPALSKSTSHRKVVSRGKSRRLSMRDFMRSESTNSATASELMAGLLGAQAAGTGGNDFIRNLAREETRNPGGGVSTKGSGGGTSSAAGRHTTHAKSPSLLKSTLSKNARATSGVTGDVLNSALTRFMRRRGSTVKLPVTKPRDDPTRNSAITPPTKSAPTTGAADTSPLVGGFTDAPAPAPPGMSRRLFSNKSAAVGAGKSKIRRPSGKLRPPEFSSLLGSRLDRDMEVGILSLLSIIDAVIAVIDADVDDVGNTLDSKRSHGLNILRRTRLASLGNLQPQDLVATASKSTSISTGVLALTEEGAERIMRMIVTLLHHPAAGTMLFRELSGEERIIDAFLDSLLAAVTCDMALPRHWAIKSLWRCLALYRDMKLLHGSSVSERGFVDAVQASLAVVGTFGVDDYQALLQILLNQVVLPTSNESKGLGQSNAVEPFGKHIANPHILPLIFDALIIADTQELRRNALKDLNYVLVSKNERNFQAFIGENGWHEWMLPLIGRVPYDPFLKLRGKAKSRAQTQKTKATLPQGPPTEGDLVSQPNSQAGKAAHPQMLTEIQRESLHLTLNIYAMVHLFAVRDATGTFQIRRVLNKCVETLQKFVGGCMTHDAARVGRAMLTGLASKVVQPKHLAAWKNDFESDEWGQVLAFLAVCKEFLFKKRIPDRANEDNPSDFIPCDAWAVKELEQTRQRLQNEGYGPNEVIVRPMLRVLTTSAASDVHEKRMMGIVHAPTAVGRKRQMGRRLSTKAASSLQEFGIHLDPESFTCSDMHLVDVACRVLVNLGYRGGNKPKRRERRKRLSMSEQIFGQMMEKAVSSPQKIKHVSADETCASLSRKSQERIAMGAELLQDFYDIRQLFAEIDAMSPSLSKLNAPANVNPNADADADAPSHAERVTEAFYNYMKRAKKRQKTGFISNKYSKKQVVNQMRGEIQKVKARKLIQAQSTRFMMRVQQAKAVRLDDLLASEEGAAAIQPEIEESPRHLQRALGPRKYLRKPNTRVAGLHGRDLRRRASSTSWKDEIDLLGIDVSASDVDDSADEDCGSSPPPPPPGVCNVCSKRTHKNNTVVALGVTWCLNHFRCSVCDRTPTDLEFFEHDGLIFCADDWLDSAQGKNVCATCYDPLSSVSTKTSSNPKGGHDAGGYAVAGRVYHKDCLVCTRCSDPLRSPDLDEEGASVQIFSWNKRPFCEPCYGELYRKCPGCGQDPGEKGEAWCGKNWHGDCFRCRACGVKFQSQDAVKKAGGVSAKGNKEEKAERTVDRYYTMDADDGAGEMPYCEEHFHKMFAPKCATCSEPVINGEDTWRAMGRTYHKHCFSCAVCDCSFPDGQFFSESGRPYCEEHFLEMFGSKCFRCDKFITGDVLNALDKTWHEECFVCEGCGDEFNNYNYYGHGNRAYCEGCFCKRFADKCPGCGKYVVSDGIQIRNPGTNEKASWHVECLCCTHCKCPLGLDDEIFISNKDGQPYCAKDFKELCMNICTACGEPIEDETMAEVEDGRGSVQKYHTSCFACVGCSAPLDKSFFHMDASVRAVKMVADGEEDGVKEKYAMLKGEEEEGGSLVVKGTSGEESKVEAGAEAHEDIASRVQFCVNCHKVQTFVGCSKCGQSIDPGSPSRALGDGTMWHVECMCCVFCESPFQPGQKMCQWNGLLVCTDCYTCQFNPQCVSCGERIVAGQPRMRVLGALYHSDCLTCIECEVDVKSKPYRRDVPDPPGFGKAKEGKKKKVHAWSVCNEHRLESWVLTDGAMERVKARCGVIVATVERKARQDELLVEKLEEMKRGKATLDKHEREKGALLGRVRRTLFERFLRERGGSEWFARGNSSAEEPSLRDEDEEKGGREGGAVSVMAGEPKVSTVGDDALDDQSADPGATCDRHSQRRQLRTASGAEIHLDEDSGARYKVYPETGESVWIEEDDGADADDDDNDEQTVVEGALEKTEVDAENELEDEGVEEVDLPEGWESAYDDGGNRYFYNESTGRSSWTQPTES